MHNLLQQDPRYGTVSTFQAIVPTFFLIGRGWLQRRMAKSLTATRPTDNVRVSLDAPIEEEIAIGNICALSAVHHLSFPRRTGTYCGEYLTMKDLTKRELARWDRVYLDVLRKTTLDNGGRPLVLKSPNNTGRISHLLRLFPDAKFIHIVRNSYDVYRSMVHLYRKVMPLLQLQAMPAEDMAEHVLSSYKVLMQHFLRNRALIPSGNLVEVRFEDLERQPIAELKRLYAELALPNWDRAHGPIGRYLQTLVGYRKNRFSADRSIIDRVEREWRFALDVWPYPRPA